MIMVLAIITLELVAGVANPGQQPRAFELVRPRVVHVQGRNGKLSTSPVTDPKSGLPHVTRGRGGHAQHFKVHIPFQGNEHILEMTLNNALIPQDFSAVFVGEGGKRTVRKGLENCYYQGHVKGHEGVKSTAILHTCSGHLHGHFQLNNERYYIHKPKRQHIRSWKNRARGAGARIMWEQSSDPQLLAHHVIYKDIPETPKLASSTELGKNFLLDSIDIRRVGGSLLTEQWLTTTPCAHVHM